MDQKSAQETALSSHVVELSVGKFNGNCVSLVQEKYPAMILGVVFPDLAYHTG